MVKSWGTGCLRQALIATGVFLVFVMGFVALIVISVSLPLTENQRLVIWLAGFGLVILLLASGLLIWRSRLGRGRTAVLDDSFISTGLSGKGYLWNGRQYHGIYQGHQVDIYFYRGPSLDIYIEAPLNTRLGIGMHGYLGRRARRDGHQPRLVTNFPALAHLEIYPLDETWARAVLDDPVAKAIILQLTSPGTSLESRNLLFQPEAIQLQIHHMGMVSITEENLHTWLNSLLELAVMAASLPAPKLTATASAMERRTRLIRSDFTLLFAGITCGILGLFLAILITVVVLFYKLVLPGL